MTLCDRDFYCVCTVGPKFFSWSVFLQERSSCEVFVIFAKSKKTMVFKRKADGSAEQPKKRGRPRKNAVPTTAAAPIELNVRGFELLSVL